VSASALAAPPANDNFADAAILDGDSGTLSMVTTGATFEPGEPHAINQFDGASVWFTWQPGSDGQVGFDTLGSSYDTVLAIYQGDALTSLTLIRANDDRLDGQLPKRTSLVRFAAKAGEVYRVTVAGLFDDSGDLALSWGPASPATPPQVETGIFRGALRTALLVDAKLTSVGDSETEYGICLSTLPNPTLADPFVGETTRIPDSKTFNIYNLAAGTTYFIRAYATNEGGTVFGEEISATTTPRLLAQYRVSGSGSDLGKGNEVKHRFTGTLLMGLDEGLAALVLTWQDGKTKRYQVQDWRAARTLNFVTDSAKAFHGLISVAAVTDPGDSSVEQGLLARRFTGKAKDTRFTGGPIPVYFAQQLSGGIQQINQSGAKLGQANLKLRFDSKASVQLADQELSFDEALANLVAAAKVGREEISELPFGTAPAVAPDHAGLVVYKSSNASTAYDDKGALKEKESGYWILDPAHGQIAIVFQEGNKWVAEFLPDQTSFQAYLARGKKNVPFLSISRSDFLERGHILYRQSLEHVVGKMAGNVDLGGLRGTVAKSMKGFTLKVLSDNNQINDGKVNLRLDTKNTKKANQENFTLAEFAAFLVASEND
jgi:hypothetical protein